MLERELGEDETRMDEPLPFPLVFLEPSRLGPSTLQHIWSNTSSTTNRNQIFSSSSLVLSTVLRRKRKRLESNSPQQPLPRLLLPHPQLISLPLRPPHLLLLPSQIGSSSRQLLLENHRSNNSLVRLGFRNPSFDMRDGEQSGRISKLTSQGLVLKTG